MCTIYLVKLFYTILYKSLYHLKKKDKIYLCWLATQSSAGILNTRTCHTFCSLAAHISFRYKFQMRLEENLAFTNVTVDKDVRSSNQTTIQNESSYVSSMCKKQIVQLTSVSNQWRSQGRGGQGAMPPSPQTRGPNYRLTPPPSFEIGKIFSPVCSVSNL